MAAATLSDAAADALRVAEATATTITLKGQLDRKVYVEVNKVLTRIGGGGRWDRKAGAHVYASDPRPDLAALIGEDPDAEIAMPEDADKIASFWRTPPDIVEEMLVRAGVSGAGPRAMVLEPSAGDGAIADAIRAAAPHANLICVEADERRADILRGKGHRTFTDLFENAASVMIASVVRFHAIVMNPPFTTRTDPKAWATHVDLALDLLAPRGRLVAVVPASYQFGTTRKIGMLRERISELGGSYDPLATDAFVASGTGVQAGLIAVAR